MIDKQRVSADALVGLYGAVGRSACWILGAGPSLNSLSPETILRIQGASGAGRFAMNYAGRGKDGEGWVVRPTMWTCYDPTARFSRATFHDPSILKFVRGSRHADLVPETTEKVDECPSTVFFDVEFRKYSNFVYPAAEKVNDSLDSLILCIDIAYLLGFRELFLLGTDMRIKPSQAQIDLAEQHGVSYPVVVEGRSSDRLKHFLQAYAKARGIKENEACKEMETVEREAQYAFDETKSFGAAVACDTHYWERVEYLRLSRKTFAQAGLTITSCTPGSRLNTWFPHKTAEEVCDYLLEKHGDPRKESTAGKYTERQQHSLPWHKDIAPHLRVEPKKEIKKVVAPAVEEMKKREVVG